MNYADLQPSLEARARARAKAKAKAKARAKAKAKAKSKGLASYSLAAGNAEMKIINAMNARNGSKPVVPTVLLRRAIKELGTRPIPNGRGL